MTNHPLRVVHVFSIASELRPPTDFVPEPVQFSKRIRINVSTTSKGVKSYDCTVEIEGLSMEAVLAESDRLVAALDKRYPALV